MIALLCSVQAEADLLIEAIALKSSVTTGCKPIREGTIAGREVLLCIGGMGKANAAHAAGLLLTRPGVDLLMVFGIGGAYPGSGAQTGDVALAAEEISADEGVLTTAGFRDTEFIGIPLVKIGPTAFYNRFPAPEPILSRSLRALASFPARVHHGPFVTVSTCTGTLARGQELAQRHQGLCENMEGAAAAQVALLHGVPWLEVRGISNLVTDRDLRAWDIPGAARTAQEAVIAILEEQER